MVREGRIAELKQQVVVACQEIVRLELALATEGNVSAFDRDSGLVVITPTKARDSLGDLTPEDLVVVDPHGKVIEGAHRPSSEVLVHCEIYRQCTRQPGAIVHTHSAYATILGITGLSLEPICMSDAVALGKVPIVPYALSGSEELARAVVTALNESKADAAILKNHGALSIGSDPRQALFRARVLEKASRMMVYCSILGGVSTVPEADIRRWRGDW